MLDALVERHYESIIQSCRAFIDTSDGNALDKLAVLLNKYRELTANISFDKCLHMPQNAAIHQKSLAKILESLSKVIADLIEEGIDEGIFACQFPLEYAEIIMSVFTFLLDPGIFSWETEKKNNQMKALAKLLEKGLSAKPGSFRFLYKI